MNIKKIDDASLLTGIDLLKSNWEISDKYEIYAIKGEKLNIKFDGNSIYITYPLKSSFYRALSLISIALSKGQTEEITETLWFDECGVMLDMSRNGVMTVDAVKKYVNYMALMGLNQLYLYTEDTYEVEGCPYLGYMRGRYTKEELKAIDEYCDKIGVEAIPHIQTLGHMEQYIKWDEGMKYRDTEDILIPGEEYTYDFIKKIIQSVTSCFKTKKIHLGMDEAGNLGSGRYYAINGLVDRKKILIDHMKRVIAIAEDEGLIPIIYGDVLFAVASGSAYEVAGAKLSDDLAQISKNYIPVSWGYYDKDFETYKNKILAYKEITGKTIFWGGIWTWFGFAPDNKMTVDTMGPALAACKEVGVRSVIGSSWADDGCECNHFYGLFGMMYFAENMYNKEIDNDKFKERFEYITKASFNAFYEMSYFHNDFDHYDGYSFYVYRFFGKRFVYADVLLGPMDENLRIKPMSDYYKNLRGKFKGYVESANEWKDMYAHIERLIDIACRKCYIMENLKRAYDENNKDFLKHCAQILIPELIDRFDEFARGHKKQWMSTYKSFGYEVLDIRYGGVIRRLMSAQEKIIEYLEGKISNIEELEQTRLLHDCEWISKNFHSVVTGSHRI